MLKQDLLKMDLQFFAEEEPTFTIDDFKTFAESNEDAQKFLQSQSQSVADKQLESWKANNLDKIKQDTIKDYETAKKNKTPEQIAFEKLQADFEAEKALRVTSDNKAYVAQQVSEIALEGELKSAVSDFMLTNLVSADTEFTQKAVEAFTGLLSSIQESHADAIKNMQMESAYGKKQQQQTKTEENIDPMKALGEGLGQLLGGNQ